MKVRKTCGGQTSLEYMLVYAFGVLFVIFVVIISWQSGVFTRTIRDSGSKGFSQVVVSDFLARENLLNISVRNNAPDAVRITEINASVEYALNCVSTTLVDLKSGEMAAIDLKCDDFEAKYPPGTYYGANIDVQYINIRTNNLHHSLGTIWGIVE